MDFNAINEYYLRRATGFDSGIKWVVANDFNGYSRWFDTEVEAKEHLAEKEGR